MGEHRFLVKAARWLLLCYATACMNGEFYLILPNIRSCHNVGALFRTADAFGVTKIYLVGYTATPPRKEIDKVSLGAEQWVPWEKRGYLKPLMKSLKKAGVQLVALEKSARSSDLVTVSLRPPVALIVGNEVTGLPTDILALCDLVLHIPMHGFKESLNVSVAAGIALHEVRRKLDQVAGV